MARLKFTPEVREDYLKTLAHCGKYALCNRIHGISKTTICRTKAEIPGFRKRCEQAVEAFERKVTKGSASIGTQAR